MSDVRMSYVHIHAPPVTRKAAQATKCPDCQRRTRMLSFFQEWYGWHSTCLRCGRQWDGGEWLPLEFQRGVRKANIARAKQRWRMLAAPTLDEAKRIAGEGGE